MREIPVEWTARVLRPCPVLLLSSRHERRSNLAPLTRYALLSQAPTLIGFSLAPSSMSCHLVRQSGECILCVPDVSLLSEVHDAGIVSGRDCDKLRRLRLLLRGSRCVAPFVPVGALASLECEVRESRLVGGDRHFVVQVVSAEVDDEAFGEEWRPESAAWFHHLGGDRYLCRGEVLRAQPVVIEADLPLDDER
ncbi:flavin reductase [bacterium]|nr:flavin reductase [bacterium]